MMPCVGLGGINFFCADLNKKCCVFFYFVRFFSCAYALLAHATHELEEYIRVFLWTLAAKADALLQDAFADGSWLHRFDLSHVIIPLRSCPHELEECVRMLLWTLATKADAALNVALSRHLVAVLLFSIAILTHIKPLRNQFFFERT